MCTALVSAHHQQHSKLTCFDRSFGPLNTIIPFSLLSAVLTYVWLGVHTSTGLYIFSCFYGIAAAGMQGLWPATLAGLTQDLSKIGTRTGMGFSIVSVATLTGTPLGGAVVSRMGGSYVGAEVWAGTSFAVGWALMCAARWLKVGWRLEKL